MHGEGGRSREAVRNSVRAYGVKVMDPASLPLRKTQEAEPGETEPWLSQRPREPLRGHPPPATPQQPRTLTPDPVPGCCKKFLSRVPFATLFATVVCLLGAIVVIVEGQRVAILTNNMVQNFLDRQTIMMTFGDSSIMVLVIVTVTVAVLVLLVGILATGDTRQWVYRGWKARVGGRLGCAVLIIVTFLLFLFWLFMFWLLTTWCYIVVIAKRQCDYFRENPGVMNCINLPLQGYYYTGKTPEICGSEELKKFCKDYVEKAIPAYLLAEIATILVLSSLVLFLVCLSANYARIQCQRKIQELQELRDLELDHQNSKDRF